MVPSNERTTMSEASRERENKRARAKVSGSGTSAPRVVCWGELLWDLFPDGACLGGAPSNVAVHLAQLACPTALVTSLGIDDLGEAARQELGRRGLCLDGLQEHAHLPTGRVGIELRAGEPHYTLHEGAWRDIACDGPALELVASASAIVFGTLSQERPEGHKSWQLAMHAASSATIKICDPNLRGGRIVPDLVREHMRAADVVKINDGELGIFEKTYGVADGIQWLLEDMQATWVAHTHGARGATLYSAAGSANHPGYAASAGGDNVGAGDAFTAVLTLAALARTPLIQAVDAANRVGSFVASQRGATPEIPAWLRSEVRALLGETSTSPDPTRP